MNSEKELELYRAFAASKPIEFEGFKVAWLCQNPDVPTVIAEVSEVTVVSEVKEELPAKSAEFIAMRKKKRAEE